MGHDFPRVETLGYSFGHAYGILIPVFSMFKAF